MIFYGISMMKKITTISIVLLGLMVCSGCQWTREHFDWPWKKKEVPVTKAEWVTKEQWPATAPADVPTTQPVEVEPAPESQPLVELEPATQQVEIIGTPKSVTAGVLQVKGNFITLEDLVAAQDTKLAELAQKTSTNQFKEYAARILSQELARKINDELILNEANARMNEQQKAYIDSEVDQARQKLLARAGGSIKKLENDLAESGTSLDQVLQTQKRAITVQLYLRMKFLPAVAVNRQMLMDYYNTHLDEFTQQKKVQMQIAACPFDEFFPKDVSGIASSAEKLAARSAARDVARQAKERVDAGEDFTAVVRELSKGIKAQSGGIWPMMAVGSFREKQVESAAFGMGLGQVSDIIETSNGFYIVKVYKLQPGVMQSFEQAQESITATLRQQQYDKLVEEFRKRLEESAHKYYDKDFVALAVQRACEIHLGK